MSNFIKHYNDSQIFYNLEWAYEIIQKSNPFIIEIMLDIGNSSPYLVTETFENKDARNERLSQLLMWSGTSPEQFPT